MGMGLDIQKEGHHIAFAGGTGALVFLDLVAMLVLKLCSPATSTGDTVNSMINDVDDQTAVTTEISDNFKFTFYLTAPSEEEAIGLKLC